MSQQIYCGDSDVPEGKVAGSLSQCMRKGIGVGLYGVAPKKYGLTEEQVAREKQAQLEDRKRRYERLGIKDIYCGDGEPAEGQERGSRFKCMKRGIGVGLNVLAPERLNVNYLKPYTLTRQDIYIFARKLNIPIRDENGNVKSVEDVTLEISRVMRDAAVQDLYAL